MSDFRVIDSKQETYMNVGECFVRMVAMMKTGDKRLMSAAGTELEKMTRVVSQIIERDHPSLKLFLLDEEESA